MKIINESEFLREIKEGVVVVDFFASWCGPCRMMGAVLEEVDKELNGKAKILKVDVDQSQNLARQFGVMSIPTIVVFKDGKQVHKQIGFVPKERLVALISNYLG